MSDSELYDYCTYRYQWREYEAAIRRKVRHVTVAGISLRPPKGASVSMADVTYTVVKRELWPHLMIQRGRR